MEDSKIYSLKSSLTQHRWHILAIIVLVLLECLLIGYLGYWREFFWESVQKKELHNFLVLIAQFTVAALGICFVSGYTTYLVSTLGLKLRKDLTVIAITRDFKAIEGGEQRVQEDCFRYPLNAVLLLVGLLRNVLILSTFVVIISVQVGALYLIIPIVYTLVGTGIAGWIAKPLIKLNYLIQVVEAKFRRQVLSIGNLSSYQEVDETNKTMFIATKKLNYFQSFYNQVTVVVPYLILFPLYFGGTIVFGVFMQVASSMGHVIDSLSYIINSFNDINNWLSCRKRLQELGVIK